MVVVIVIISMFENLVVDSLTDLALVMRGFKVIFVLFFILPHARVVIGCCEAAILVSFKSHLLIATMFAAIRLRFLLPGDVSSILSCATAWLLRLSMGQILVVNQAAQSIVLIIFAFIIALVYRTSCRER